MGIKVTVETSNGEGTEYEISLSDIIKGGITAWIAYMELMTTRTKR